MTAISNNSTSVLNTSKTSSSSSKSDSSPNPTSDIVNYTIQAMSACIPSIVAQINPTSISETNSTSLSSSSSTSLTKKNSSNNHAPTSSSTSSTLATMKIASDRFEGMSDDLIYEIVQWLPMTEFTMMTRLNHSFQGIIRCQLQRDFSDIQSQINLTRCIDLYASLKIIGLQGPEIANIFANKRYTVFLEYTGKKIDPDPKRDSFILFDDQPPKGLPSEHNKRLALNSSSILANIPIPARQFERIKKDGFVKHFKNLDHSKFTLFLTQCLERINSERWRTVCEAPNFQYHSLNLYNTGYDMMYLGHEMILQPKEEVARPIEDFLIRHQNQELITDEFVIRDFIDFVYTTTETCPYLYNMIQQHYAQSHYSINQIFDCSPNPYHERWGFPCVKDERLWLSILDARRVDFRRMFHTK